MEKKNQEINKDDINLTDLKLKHANTSERKHMEQKNRQYLEALNQIYLKNTMQNLKTNILCHLGPNRCTMEFMESLVLEGIRNFILNLGLLSINHVKQAVNVRNILEIKHQISIAVHLTLHGNIPRVGELDHDEVILKKGQEFRLIDDYKIIGNSLYVGVNNKKFMKKQFRKDDVLVMDHGQISLQVQQVEDLQTMMQQFNRQYEEDMNLGNSSNLEGNFALRKWFKSEKLIGAKEAEQKLDILIKSKGSHHKTLAGYNSPNTCTNFDDDFESFTREKSRSVSEQQLELESKHQEYNLSPPIPLKESLQISVQNQKTTVVVCEVQSDCVLRNFKPIYFRGKQFMKKNQERINFIVSSPDEINILTSPKLKAKSVDSPYAQKQNVPVILSHIEEKPSFLQSMNEEDLEIIETQMEKREIYSKRLIQLDVADNQENVEFELDFGLENENLNDSIDLQASPGQKEQSSPAFSNPPLIQSNQNAGHNGGPINQQNLAIEIPQSNKIKDSFENFRLFPDQMNNKSQDINLFYNGEVQDSDEEADEDPQEDVESYLNSNDMNDITEGINIGIDTLILTNIQNAQQIRFVKDNYFLDKEGIKIISRIEIPEALANINQIIEESDGITIMRSYLMVHIPVERLHFQITEIIELCNQMNQQVFVAGDILESMIKDFMPTSCEGSEISNLVMKGVDGFELGSETILGLYPKQCIRTLTRICMESEKHQIINYIENPLSRITMKCQSPEVELAYNTWACVIIVFTKIGKNFIQISKAQPPCPLVVVTNQIQLSQYLNIVYGALPYYVEDEIVAPTSSLQSRAFKFALNRGFLKAGDQIILVYSPNEQENKNNIEIVVYE